MLCCKIVAMILFNLICAQDHEFEGWFRNGDAYDAQVAVAIRLSDL